MAAIIMRRPTQAQIQGVANTARDTRASTPTVQFNAGMAKLLQNNAGRFVRAAGPKREAQVSNSKMRALEDRIALMEAELSWSLDAQGPDFGSGPDLVRNTAFGIDPNSDPYHGGVITSEFTTVADNAAAGTLLPILFSDTAAARLRECRQWSIMLDIMPGSANGGALANLREAAKVSAVYLRNGIPLPGFLNVPLSFFVAEGNGAGGRQVQLGGVEFVGTDIPIINLAILATLTGNVGESSLVRATILAGGTVDPYKRSLRYGG